MGITITTKKSELCWLYHEYTWTKKNYDDWKQWLIGIAEKHNWQNTEDDYWTASNIALAKLIQNLEWDEVATHFENDDDLSYEFEVKVYNGEMIKRTVSLNESLADAMGEDAWDADYEVGDACDTDTEYEFNEIEEEDE